MAIRKSIGIKLYDDSFVPVLTEGEVKNKKLILTTVKDNQKKAVIELYEGTSDKCSNNEYLGKLVINIDRETEKGEPGIEVHLRLDENGILYAKAWDIESGMESEIKIENTELNKIAPETLSDFELNNLDENEEAKKIESYDEEQTTITNNYYEETEKISSYNQLDDNEEEETYKEKSKDIFPVIRVVLFILIAIIIATLLGLGGYFLYNTIKNEIIIAKEKKIAEQQRLEEEKRKQEELARLEEERKIREQQEKEKAEELKRLQEEEELAKQRELERQKKLEEEKRIAEQKKAEELKKLEEQKKLEEKNRLSKVKGKKDRKGKKHFIRWGDNLWNICKKYYKDPWYYPSLAEYNYIKKPRLIFAGTYIIIPPKSELKRWDFKK